jgi:LmbE family N-acetylglucosaminyl deacetylase
MLKAFRHKLGQLYWCVVKAKETATYHVKKYFRSLAVWIHGIGTIHGDFTGADQTDTLVVCAHPDDETIFFSSVIQDKRPFIVCMSHAGNSIRRNEFTSAIERQNVTGAIMLNCPDIPGAKRFWVGCAIRGLRGIKKHFPNVKTVYTHAGFGESGHPHHIAVQDAVVRVFDGNSIFYTAITLKKVAGGGLDNLSLATKEQIIRECYPTQVNMLYRWCDWFEDYLHFEEFEAES